MTEIHGVTGAPYKTPSVRRKLPAPFSRTRIDLDGGAQLKRSWKDVPVVEIKAGDIVANFGRVQSVNEFIKTPSLDALTDREVTWRVRLINVMNEYQDFPGHERLFAFTPDEPV